MEALQPNESRGSGTGKQARPVRHLFRTLATGILLCVLGAQAAPAGAKAADDEEFRKSIGAFIDHYFYAWSNRDMIAYRNCFDPDATIVFLDRSNVPTISLSLDQFIRSQEKAHRQAVVEMREVPAVKHVTALGDVGQAAVRWNLFKGTRTVTGIDLFTLVSRNGRWKIIHLAVRNR